MLRSILVTGVLAGVAVAAPMFLMIALSGPGSPSSSQFVGYLIMILALSLIFMAVKRRRDRVLGGVIRFLPAFLMGLGVSAVASVVYVIGWEITLALTNHAFIDAYAAAAVEQARARGAPAADIERLVADMEQFKTMYANPLFRLPITFVEIFPVGVLISLITAGLLRNRRFLPARPPAS